MRWTQAEIDVIHKYYADKGPEFCSRLLKNRNRRAVGLKGRSLGYTYHGPKLGVYKKGHIPSNKGKKMSPEVYEKAKATMFKKGRLPHNTRSDGEISLRKDDSGRYYKYIRIDIRKWELYHRVLWEKHYGPIPDDKVIRFKNGDSTDCRIENLQLLNRDQHLCYNINHQYPDDLKETIYLNTKLKKELTNATK